MEPQHHSEQYEPGKLFVGGLSWETTDESMRAYFERFGEVKDCTVMKDSLQPPGLKKNRGFGFVQFEDPQTVGKVLEAPSHFLDGKTIDPKLAQVKGGPVSSGDHSKKIFLGGISSSTSEDQIRAHFESFGQGCVVSVDFKIDKNTNRLRGFGFVEFTSEAIRDKVVAIRFHDINGKRVEAKKAEPRGASISSSAQQQLQQMQYHHTPYYPQAGGGSANGQYTPYYAGTSGYYYPTQQQSGYTHQQYSGGAGSYYDPPSYPRTQSSSGERSDQQQYYPTPPSYGHGGGQQMGSGYPHTQDTGGYGGRHAYQSAPETSYNQPMAGYGAQAATQQQQAQQQPHYGGGASGSYTH